ncbi:MAG TPA: ABC transporter ATP-binding protein [Methylomirabilota bacterium]|nr:ABC transporter ATP-binding protein [Methylomirabilota bacterium]
MSPARRVLGYLRPYAARYGAGVGCLALATGFSLGIPWQVKEAIDGLRGGGGALAFHAGVIAVLAALHAVARLASRFTMLGAGQWVEHDVRRDLYAHLETLSPAFYLTHRTGDLMSRAANDVQALRALAGFGAVMLASTTFTFAGTLAAMWAIDPRLTLWALAPSPLLVLLARRFNHQVAVESTAVQEQLGALSARVQENLTGMPVVRAYTMEAREIDAFGRLNGEYLARSLRLARTQAAFSPMMGLISGLGGLIVLWVGGMGVLDGRLTLGAFVAFTAYLAHLAWPTIALGWTLANLKRGLAAMTRIAEILDTPGHVEDPETVAADGGSTGAINQDRGPRHGAPNPQPPLLNGPIEFRRLSFGYDGRGRALDDVSFTVPEGATVVVVGPTGSGKSTLGALLSRLYEPPPGTVFIGGRDVRELPRERLRRSMGYVPQEAFLFSRSISDNVALGDETAPEARLRASAETAGLGSEIERFPEGWATVVGERGLTLSGGQRQRVALARSLVPEPAILVLDDVFSAVDAGKEAEILRSLRAAVAGRTTLVMTHRLRVAQEADRIVVLDEGRVVEQGTHAALLASGGLYARLWRIQQIEQELADD